MEFRYTPSRIAKRLAFEIYENGALYKTENMIRFIIFWGVLIILWIGNYFPFLTSFFIAFLVYVCIGGWKYMFLIYKTLGRDLRALYRLSKMKMFIRKCRKRNATVGEIFQSLVKKHPNKTCIMHEDKKWTFQDIEDYSNQVANCFHKLGFQYGDDVALFMDSKVEFVAIWLGLSKIGVVPALINSNLRQQSLAFSITVVNCKAVIFGSELIQAVSDVSPLLKDVDGLQYFCLGEFDSATVPAKSLDTLIPESPTTPPKHHKGSMNDRLFYVYTSGTTGMPKAAIIRHSRFMWLGAGIHHMNTIQDDDVLYTALPLYHTAGGILSLSQTLLFGNTCGIRSKFSASKFWDDCIKYEATVAQYIGELCRYILAQPEKPQDRQHQVRLMFGNGLRPQIWQQFVDRFNIPNIGELYGSTEGNANVINIDNKVGAVGFMSRIIPTIYPVSLIKVDANTGEPIRDNKGLCIRCEPGEPGEFVGKIITSDPIRQFDGYVNQSATKKKIIRDCFTKGDMAFLSGDLLMMDEDGYLFFVDRTGDTFRWRGENVSTMEVEGMISNILHHTDSVVYGVEVPGNEGRAGMAAISDPEHKVDLKHLFKELSLSLPGYAVPLFVRICDSLESTGTFKLKKVDLQKEGFNPSTMKDPLYYLNKKEGAYVPLDAEVYEKICNGQIRL
ncbi:long-chain fatty acid transport protein 1-like isoform X2 [Argiope bruennichi]|uniref:long-chain fatty acid transport protein 1-like isoform X2 n=1 Tax=Argiope bruennichi TaxID=94029 RepID=UPI002493EEE4|nr:long-chain fatty acid transport protein 1-like isoform X2 [Argiope bruennichi]